MAAAEKTGNIEDSEEKKASSPIEPKSIPSQQESELSASEEGGYDDSKNPFRDPVVAQHWREVYETSKYECRHVFDPTLTWTTEEEKRLVRKLDWRICLWAVSDPQRAGRFQPQERGYNFDMQCVMFFGLQVDRANLAQAVSDNMLDDLGLNTNGK